MRKSHRFLKSSFSSTKTMFSFIDYQNIFKKIQVNFKSDFGHMSLFLKGSSKAQSAMEYLMTYGWSILIIAIVLVSLFELGIFGSSSLSGNGSCIAQTQFLCTKPILASNGILMATIGETLGQVTLTGIACINNTSQPSSFNAVSPVTINNGETFQIGFYCHISSNAIGTSFNGNLWMQYNTPVASGQIIKIGSVSLKVTISSTSGSEGSGSGIVYYAPITLSNQQSSSTSSGFQQMIYFNPSAYSSNEMANLSNIEFTADAPIGTSGNVPLYAWIESGASSSATNTVAWVNLASNTLGAAGSGTNTLTIYMNFLPNNSPVTSGYTGYAPQLYCTSGCFQTSYAQYDNGASVFNFYDNFAGTTLNTNKWNNYASSGVTGNTENILVDNGLTFSQGTTGYNTYIGSSAQTLTTNTIMDIYWTPATTGGSQIGYISVLGRDLGDTQGAGVQFYSNGYYLDSNNGAISQTQFGSYSIQKYLSSLSVSTSAVNGYLNDYVLTGSVTTNLNTIPPSSPLYLEIAQYSPTYNTLVTWVRTRSYPPNGEMPSSSFGGVV